MSERLLNMLGLMRKANAAAIGEANAGEVCREHRAKLLLLASDASDNAVRRAESFVSGRKTLLITLPFTKEEISRHVGVSGCSMLAVNDLGFADAFLRGLAEYDPDSYGKYSEIVEMRLKKAVKRKRETENNRKKVLTGKRED